MSDKLAKATGGGGQNEWVFIYYNWCYNCTVYY